MTPSRIDIVRPQEVQPLSVGARDAARLLGISQRTLEKIVAARGIPSATIGGRRVFVVKSLERWLTAREEGAVAMTTEGGDVA